MKIAVTSILGNPRNPRTWSNAPAHLIEALELRGHQIEAIDSSCLSGFDKAAMVLGNAAIGRPLKTIGWFKAARQKRARHVASMARSSGCELVICTGTLDAPVDEDIPFAIWVDNTFALLQRSAAALPYSMRTVRAIEDLEKRSFRRALAVLTFSEHVRKSVIEDYDVPVDCVHAVGCGSGPLSPYNDYKDFHNGHLLFVAKHLFSSKGGDLVLDAFSIIRKARPKTRLVLVGNDEARSKAAGIEGVDVYGFLARDALDELFYDAAMLVQPMLADPWGQVYLEAMKARAVVVSLNVAALPELTDYGRLGVLIERASPQELANAVLSTYGRTQSELDIITRAAQNQTLTRYSWNAVADRVSRVLRLDNLNDEMNQ